MAKMKPETKAKIKGAVRHPVVWWKGEGLPEEDIRPWEGGIQFFGRALHGFYGGFASMRGRMYEGMAEGKIPPAWLGVAAVPRITWDAINDPIIGVWMDRNRPGPKFYRLIMRVNATLSPIFTWFLLLNLGIAPLTRLIMWTAFDMVWDVMSTTNSMCDAKMWAGITPHTKQRGIVQLCATLGSQMGAAFSAIPLVLMGLRDALGITDYQIMVVGASIFLPMAIFCRWLPSFAKQRVDFTIRLKGEGQTEEAKPPTFKESFAVVRHNRWWLMWTILGFFTLFIPGTDGMFLYRFLLPQTEYMQKMMIGGKPINGEMILFIKNTIMGNPGTFLQPFALKFINKFIDRFGSLLYFFRFRSAFNFAAAVVKYFIGYKTFPRLMSVFVIEMFEDILTKWAPVADGMIGYQMLDYVEWKTGHRSEGMQGAVDGMLNKLVKSNMSNVWGNMVRQWTQYQGWDIPVEQQPPRFLKTIWPLMHIGGVVGGIISLGALFWFKYPHDPKEVEADLIERRALAAKLKEAQQEASAAG